MTKPQFLDLYRQLSDYDNSEGLSWAEGQKVPLDVILNIIRENRRGLKTCNLKNNTD